MTTTRNAGEFSTGHHNERILYLRGVDRDRDLMVATFFRRGVASAVSTVLNRHLEEVIQEILGNNVPATGVPVKMVDEDE